MKTIVITSWYFNPIHPWHLECLELCKDLGDELRVIVNNDHQVKLKTWDEKPFQDEKFRLKIVLALKSVDNAIIATDQDWSVVKSIEYISELIRTKYGEDTKIIFWKGWDRFAWNIPEVEVCKICNISIKDWLGEKIHSSSDYRKKR